LIKIVKPLDKKYIMAIGQTIQTARAIGPARMTTHTETMPMIIVIERRSIPNRRIMMSMIMKVKSKNPFRASPSLFHGEKNVFRRREMEKKLKVNQIKFIQFIKRSFIARV